MSVGIKTFMSSQRNICCFCCNAVATSTSHFWQESQKRRRNTAPSKIGWPAHGAEFEEIQLECDTIDTPAGKKSECDLIVGIILSENDGTKSDFYNEKLSLE